MSYFCNPAGCYFGQTESIEDNYNPLGLFYRFQCNRKLSNFTEKTRSVYIVILLSNFSASFEKELNLNWRYVFYHLIYKGGVQNGKKESVEKFHTRV